MQSYTLAHPWKLLESLQPLLPFLEAVPFPLVKQIRLGLTQIHNFGTALAVLALLATLAAVIGVRDAGIATDHTAAGQRSVIAFIANVYERIGIDKTRTHNTESVA